MLAGDGICSSPEVRVRGVQPKTDAHARRIQDTLSTCDEHTRFVRVLAFRHTMIIH